LFERYFDGVLPADSETPSRLHEAMRYAALAPGKRFRPLLVLCACEAVGGRWQLALPAAAALELVHAFSLVHDDLPAMDDDDYRRGRLTTHKKYGEALGILAGDALIALAFEELTQLASHGVPAKRVVAAIEWLAYCAGSHELIGGQVLDLEAEGRPVDEAAVEEIHSRKTGALMSASLRLGGIVGGANTQALGRLATAGRALGLAFQIHDDLLNRGATLERLGKRTGTDDRRRKATYPRAAGEARARERAAACFASATAALESFPSSGNLKRLITAVAKRDR
jgi:geranylgeranyl diphosphate synthase type II